jgi:hypothetical protein
MSDTPEPNPEEQEPYPQPTDPVTREEDPDDTVDAETDAPE